MGTGTLLLIIASYAFVASTIARVFWVLLEEYTIEHSMDDWEPVAVLTGMLWPGAMIIWAGVFAAKGIIKVIEEKIDGDKSV